MSAPTNAWDGFGQQAIAVALTMPLVIALQVPLVLAFVTGEFALGMVVLVLAFGALVGLAPSFLAAATMRAWRNVRRDSPFAIAGLFAIAILAAGALVSMDYPSGNVFLVAVAVGVGVGGAFSLAAAVLTRRLAPAILALFTGVLATLTALVLLFAYAEDAPEAAAILVAINLAAAAFAGAAAYALSEPRPRGQVQRVTA